MRHTRYSTDNYPKVLRHLACALLALFCIAACAQAEDFSDTYSDTYNETEITLASSARINRDADLVIGYVASEGENLNPFYCTSRDVVSLNQLLFESVVELDDSCKPQPLLAESWAHTDYEWTFTLRQGIVFHNGANLTAYDVVDSYNKILTAGESNAYYARLASLIEGMEARDSYTLVVTARYTGYITLYAMTFPVAQSSTLNDVMARGTGPYWCTEYVQDDGIRLERNPLWWKNDPGIQSVAALRYADTSDALEALHTNEIELLCSQSSQAAQSRKLNKFTSMDYQTNAYEMLVPNLKDSSVMSDVRMRQAVMYAIDRATLVENAYLGMGVQCEVPINPSSWLYESQSAVYYYSPERALALLQECGWEDLTGDGMLNRVDGVLLRDLEVNLITYNDSTTTIHTTAVNMIASNLEKVGINVNVEVVTRKRLLQRMIDHEYDIALVGVNLSEVPDLTHLLYDEGSLNFNGYDDAEMTELLGRTGSSQTEEEMRQAYSEIQLIISEQLPIMGLLFRTGTVLSTHSLGGLSGMRTGNMLNGFEYMTP